MYSEWASLQQRIEEGAENRSVLDCFPDSVGRDVAVSVVRELAASLSPASVSSHESGPLFPGLETEKQILWTMEVICYGLSLPLSEHEALKHCVSVYCEWLTVLTIPHQTLPSPLFRDPNMYAQKICQHLANLFQVKEQGDYDISKQVVLCHRVLRTVQTVASSSTLVTRQTWEVLLKFMLTINSNLLSPPLEPGSLAEHLCERLLQVLFEIWLLACARCFPPPTLWRTMREMCAGWRHHIHTVVQWNRVCKVLTARLLASLYGPSFPQLKVDANDDKIVPAEMDPDMLAQSWFRFLHVLTNPVDLCHPSIIGQTPKFVSYAITRESTIDPIQHPCLKTLPQIFLTAMSGISVMVDAFLGVTSDYPLPSTMEAGEGPRNRVSSMSGASSDTPPQNRKLMKSQAMSPSQPGGNMSSLPPISSYMDSPPAEGPKRSDCNSILHLFGAWLFEAALTGCKLHKGAPQVPSQPRRITFAYGLPMANATSTIAYTNQPITSSVGKIIRRSSSNTPEMPAPKPVPQAQLTKPGSSNHQFIGTVPAPAKYLEDKSVDPQTYEAGRAEACGSLCRIFTRKQCDEEIKAVYLARYYLTISEGLRIEEPLSGLVLSSILFNAQDLFRIDLKGVQVLVPVVLQALELVLTEKEIVFRSIVSQQQLKRAGIHLLISLVCLPHHFKNLKIQGLLKSVSSDEDHRPIPTGVTFLSLKPRLVGLMLDALKCETDPYNLQMLLGSLYLCILDSALCEEYNKEKEAKQKKKMMMSTEIKDEETIPETLGRSSSPDSPIIMQRHYSTWLLLVECCHLVCEKLTSDWRMEYSVSLTALELLAGLARVKIHIEDPLELKKIVKSISYLIEHQCSWPSMYHSRDLHSVIVAAYHCLTVWLMEHSDLLMDRECLHCVLEVVELGISGSKSQHPQAPVPEMKHSKQSKPASMRVREAAEGVLSNILNHVGTFPSPCGPASIVSLLDEETLLSHVDYTRSSQAKFRYFVLENTTLVAILEEHLGEAEVMSPTAVLLIRGPGGRTVWSIQHRHQALKDETGDCELHYPSHPEPMEDVGNRYEIKARNFPPFVDLAPKTKSDKSIPKLKDIATPTISSDHDVISALIEEQMEYEEFTREKATEEIENAGYPNRHMEAKPPRPKEEFSPARLLLSQLGCLNLDDLMEDPSSPLPPALISLDSTSHVFPADLRILDSISSRTFDTVHVFYMKSGQRSANDILSNVNHRNLVHSQFLEFLHSLGWPVTIGHHPGWTGNMMTSWKVDQDNSPDVGELKSPDHGGCLYNGRRQVLYHADALSEVAIVVPNLPDPKGTSSGSSKQGSSLSGESSESSFGLPLPPPLASEKLKGQKEDSPRKSTTSDHRKSSTKAGPFTIPDMKVIVVWVENFDDCKHFPLCELLPETSTGTEEFLAASLSSMPRPSESGIMIIFIHALHSGLYRLAVQSSLNLAIPLVDGMVVSRRTLGAVVRQTAVNVCNRRRLESDTYSPPHVRRRLKIQDLVHKYRQKMDVPQFLASLFSDES